jgi:hypothetical protein
MALDHRRMKVLVLKLDELPARTGVRVLLEDDSYDERIVGATDPESVVANLNEKLNG